MWNFKLWKRYLYVHWQWAFHFWPLDLVMIKMHGLHSLQKKDCQRTIKIKGFWWRIPHWDTSTGHFGARMDENIKLCKSKDKMRLWRSLRLLRLLRLLRSLRPLRFLMKEKSLRMSSAYSFWYFEAKEAVEVIEVNEVIMSVEVIETAEFFRITQGFEINKLMAKISLSCCLEEKNTFE